LAGGRGRLGLDKKWQWALKNRPGRYFQSLNREKKKKNAVRKKQNRVQFTLPGSDRTGHRKSEKKTYEKNSNIASREKAKKRRKEYRKSYTKILTQIVQDFKTTIKGKMRKRIILAKSGGMRQQRSSKG